MRDPSFKKEKKEEKKVSQSPQSLHGSQVALRPESETLRGGKKKEKKKSLSQSPQSSNDSSNVA